MGCARTNDPEVAEMLQEKTQQEEGRKEEEEQQQQLPPAADDILPKAVLSDRISQEFDGKQIITKQRRTNPDASALPPTTNKQSKTVFLAQQAFYKEIDDLLRNEEAKMLLTYRDNNFIKTKLSAAGYWWVVYGHCSNSGGESGVTVWLNKDEWEGHKKFAESTVKAIKEQEKEAAASRRLESRKRKAEQSVVGPSSDGVMWGFYYESILDDEQNQLTPQLKSTNSYFSQDHAQEAGAAEMVGLCDYDDVKVERRRKQVEPLLPQFMKHVHMYYMMFHAREALANLDTQERDEAGRLEGVREMVGRQLVPLTFQKYAFEQIYQFMGKVAPPGLYRAYADCLVYYHDSAQFVDGAMAMNLDDQDPFTLLARDVVNMYNKERNN